MSQQTRNTSEPSPPRSAGEGVRAQVEAVGNALAEAYAALIDSLPGRPAGPQALADQVGVTIVTASRLMKAIALSEPIAVAEQMPGVAPLRKTIEGARKAKAPKVRIAKAREAVDAFEKLVRDNGGNRSGLSAMLTDWLPQGRREFESRRRQSIYKGISELKGISCQLDLATIALFPSEQTGMLDLLSLQGSFGVDRMRPDAVLQFGTLRSPETTQEELEESAASSTMAPHNLDGERARNGLHSVRLDQFCNLAPAPMATQKLGRNIQYVLGKTGFGPSSSVDIVLGEVNRGVLKNLTELEGTKRPYFFQIPAAPAKEMLFDLIIHKDAFPDLDPELMVYDTSTLGPARAASPERSLDLIRVSEEIEELGYRRSRLRYSGYPRYLELLDHAFAKLGLDPADFRAYRVQMSYPLHASQICMCLKHSQG